MAIEFQSKLKNRKNSEPLTTSEIEERERIREKIMQLNKGG